MSTGRPLHRLSLGLFVGLIWGLGIAAVQLLLTYELVQYARFQRDPADLSSFSLPPALLSPTRRCLALPRISRVRRCSFLDEPGNHTAGDVLVRGHHTPCSGAHRPGAIGPTVSLLESARFFVALLLACLPKLSPEVFFQVARLPGLGTFVPLVGTACSPVLASACFAGPGWTPGHREAFPPRSAPHRDE